MIPQDPEVTINDMKRLERISAADRNITNLMGLEHAANLTYVDLSGNPIYSIQPLLDKPIYYLDISSTEITSLEGIERLTELSFLHINDTEITDISPVENLSLLTFEMAGVPAANEEQQSIQMLEDKGIEVVSKPSSILLNLHYTDGD